MTIVGKGPLPFSGRVTSTSSGTPSKEGTREARSAVGQKRTPFWAMQPVPSGALEEAAAGAAAASNPVATASIASSDLSDLLSGFEHTPCTPPGLPGREQDSLSVGRAARRQTLEDHLDRRALDTVGAVARPLQLAGHLAHLRAEAAHALCRVGDLVGIDLGDRLADPKPFVTTGL